MAAADVLTGKPKCVDWTKGVLNIVKETYRTFGVYRITNKLDGMSYIGKTVNNFGDRWDCHRAQLNGGYHDNKNLQRAWDQFGEENFEFVVIEATTDKSSVDDLEIKYVKQYKDVNLAYNIDDGGDSGNRGRHMTEETKRKIGEKNRINMTGRKASEETKRKMSESHKKFYQNLSEEERKEFTKNMGAWNKGLKWSDEDRQKFSDMQKTRPNGSQYTIEDVREIRRLHEECGKTITEIAEITGIKRGTVYGIATYRRWKYAS